MNRACSPPPTQAHLQKLSEVASSLPDHHAPFNFLFLFHSNHFQPREPESSPPRCSPRIGEMHIPPPSRALRTPVRVPSTRRFASQNLKPSPQPKPDKQLIPTQVITSTPRFCVTTPGPPASSARYHRSVGPQLPQISFEIVAECPHTRARAGLLHTPHGTIETPAFMPVGTQATVKGLTQRDLAEDLGVGILLANTYHLYLRPG